jgi:RHS repeat-associated protein
LNRLTEANYSNNDYYHYTHDAVGNRKAQESMISGSLTNTSYEYDDANRLKFVNAVEYFWDTNGNLKNDGVNAYEYDTANRLKAFGPIGQPPTSTYAYNGLGDRLQETVNGNITTFTMDLNTGLTQALSDGTNSYIYGLDRIAQTQSGITDYFLGDALGSVRQLTNISGATIYARAYDPYGVTAQTYGSSQTLYGYTGEYTSNDMVYLRARHYVPYLNQFIQPDTIVPDPFQPMDWNKYLYVRDNPINYTDPSGHCPQGSCISQNTNARDLTTWLYNEMVVNANSPTVRGLQSMNRTAARMAKGLLCDIGGAIVDAQLEGIPLTEVINDVLAERWGTALAITILHGSALNDYRQLVKDGAIWDFKDEIGLKLGPGITLCGSGGCYDDIEYSVPGNIHFAYIGVAAGFPGWEIQAGAGYAEFDDPAHDPTNIEQYVGEYIPPSFFQMIGWTPWDLSTINFGDEPKDHEAVTLGIKLYENHKGQMSLAQFRTELSKYVHKFSRCSPDPKSVPSDIAAAWPYRVGYFNNVFRFCFCCL